VAVGEGVKVGGKGVMVAVGVDETVGVEVGTGEKAVQETKKERRKKERCLSEGTVLFRMGCILPLVDNFTNEHCTS